MDTKQLHQNVVTGAVKLHTERTNTPPSNCACGAERIWSGNFCPTTGWPEADCYNCLKSTIVKG